MAFLFKKKNSSFFYVGYYDKLDGKVKSYSTKTTDKGQATKSLKDFSAKLRLNLNDNNFIKRSDAVYDFQSAFDLFLEQHQHSENTKRAYRLARDHFVNSCNNKLLLYYTTQDYFKLISYLNKRKISKNSLANYTRHLYAVFQWLKKNGLIKENIIQKIKPELKDVEVIPAKHLQKIFDCLKPMPRNYYLIKLIYYCAFRVGEVLQCKIDDFDFKKKFVRVQNAKGNRIDKIPMTSDVIDLLNEMPRPEAGQLFPFRTYDSVKSMWFRTMTKLNYKYSLHQLRKTRGTELANLGVNPLFLQQFMRHTSFAVTQQYYILIDLKRAADDINGKIKKVALK